jgi:hypothetical protein
VTPRVRPTAAALAEKRNRPGAREQGDTAVELEQRANRLMRDAATLQTEALMLLLRAAAMRAAR